MLKFTPIDESHAPLLRKYYGQCTYRLCEYSLGVKLMWRDHWHPAFAESHGCLVVLNHSAHYGAMFDFPIPLPEEGDVDAALDEIDAWCVENGVPPSFGVVPEAERERLMKRYPYTTVDNDRLWQDYFYHAEDLSTFAGRRYSGQRNHINKFRKLYPDAVFRALAPADRGKVEAFWREFHKVFNKEDADAKMEVCFARRIMEQAGEAWAKTGCVEEDGKLIAIALAEVCGDTLVCHVEKALPQYEGVYPFLVQSFAAANSEGLRWINREDDAGDRGLRTSKLQYLPAFLGAKVRLLARNELSGLETIPVLKSERLVLDGLREEDRPLYNRLCLDDERNRWWGYDYREDLEGELTEDYFLSVAREAGGEFRRPAGRGLHRRGGAVPLRLQGRRGAGVPHPARVRRERVRGRSLPAGGGVEPVRPGAVQAECQMLSRKRGLPKDAGELHAPRRGGRDVPVF